MAYLVRDYVSEVLGAIIELTNDLDEEKKLRRLAHLCQSFYSSIYSDQGMGKKRGVSREPAYPGWLI